MEPSRGEVWLLSLDPARGREQGGTRPGLVISTDSFNHGPADLVFLLPITSKCKGIPFHVAVEPPEGGLTATSFVKCEDVRAVSKLRLQRRLGRVSPHTLAQILDRLAILFEM